MSAVYQKREGRDGALALDMNECLVPRPPVLQAALDSCSNERWGAYPEYGRLAAAIAARWNLSASMIRPTAGADEGISASLQAFLGGAAPNVRTIALPDPVFSVYEARAASLGARVLRVKLDDDFALDDVAFVAAGRNADIAVIVSPGNPAGRAIPAERVVAMVRSLSPVPVIVDEAYEDFSGTSALRFLPELPNAIFLRSFSKSFAIAGLRLGFLAANPDMMARVEPFILPYGISRQTVEVGERLLAEPSLPADVVRRVKEARSSTASLLSRFFPRVVESDANFVLAYHGAGAVVFRDALAERGILIKAWDSGSLSGWLRVTAFPAEWNAKVEKALREAMEALKGGSA